MQRSIERKVLQRKWVLTPESVTASKSNNKNNNWQKQKFCHREPRERICHKRGRGGGDRERERRKKTFFYGISLQLFRYTVHNERTTTRGLQFSSLAENG